ncbi:hypothetical protein Tco_0554649, partial [Tanacetum coccineum]
VCKGEKFKVLAVIVLESDKSVCSRSPCGDVTLRDLARKCGVHDYYIPKYFSTASQYGALIRLDTAYWDFPSWMSSEVRARIYHIFLGEYDVSRVKYACTKVDQSFTYGVSADVDTSYSSKSGNGLEFVQVLGYGVSV